jgi:hypothetical protein
MCVALNPTQFTTSKQNSSIFHLECVEGSMCLWLPFRGYCFVWKGWCACGFPLKAIFLCEFSSFRIACRTPRKISLWWFKFCGIWTLCQYETHTHWSFPLHQGSKQDFVIISFGFTSFVPSTSFVKWIWKLLQIVFAMFKIVSIVLWPNINDMQFLTFFPCHMSNMPWPSLHGISQNHPRWNSKCLWMGRVWKAPFYCLRITITITLEVLAQVGA